jgi:GNAT superfamily N-acetyltransferase
VAAELAIRPSEPEDTDDILELMRLSLGDGPIPRRDEYWRWKHVTNPFGPSPSLLAFAGEQLVGLRVFMRWTWRAGALTVRAVRAVDTATHPDFQGQGIFSKLTKALLEKMRAEGVSFVFNTPNNKSRPGYLKMGWISVGRVTLWLRPRMGGMIRSVVAPGSRANDDRLGSPASELVADPALAPFCEALAGRADRFSTPPSAKYLRWRYAEIPSFQYRAVWNISGRDGAVAIFRAKDDTKLRELRVCQLLVGESPRSRRMGRQLVRALVSDASAQFVSAMTSFGSPVQSVLLGSGFVPAPRLGPIMTVRPLAGTSSGPDPLKRSGWDLSIGDLELF